MADVALSTTIRVATLLVPDLREIRIVVPGAPLPPRWHTRIAPMPEPTS